MNNPMSKRTTAVAARVVADRQTHTLTHKYRNPAAHAQRVNYNIVG